MRDAPVDKTIVTPVLIRAWALAVKARRNNCEMLRDPAEARRIIEKLYACVVDARNEAVTDAIAAIGDLQEKWDEDGRHEFFEAAEQCVDELEGVRFVDRERS